MRQITPDDIIVVTKPHVWLIAEPRMHNENVVEFLEYLDKGPYKTNAKTDADSLQQFAGQCCYMQFLTEDNATYMQRIKETADGSITAHAHFTFAMTDVTRSLCHEWARHWAGKLELRPEDVAISEMSTRYAVIPPKFVLETAMRKYYDTEGSFHGSLVSDWKRDCANAYNVYLKRVDMYNDEYKSMYPDTKEGKTARRKRAREEARQHLPENIATTVITTVGGRAIRTIIEQRGSKYATDEIRQLAHELLRIMKTCSPNLVSDYIEVPYENNVVAVETPYSKI